MLMTFYIYIVSFIPEHEKIYIVNVCFIACIYIYIYR